MIRFLPPEMRQAIARAESSGDYTQADYQAACFFGFAPPSSMGAEPLKKNVRDRSG